jgi:hypothetical protein
MNHHSTPRDQTSLAVQVFPQSAVIPANILRWHLVFNQPVAIDRWSEHVRLVDDTGHDVEHAFLDLPDGLWNADGTVLTIMMHPGRIKSCVGADGDGLTLGVGQKYSLIVNLAGFALKGGSDDAQHVHSFMAGREVQSALSAADWTMTRAPTGTFAPIEVTFDRVMDMLSLQTALGVVDGTGVRIAVLMVLQSDDRRAHLIPQQPWPAEPVDVLPLPVLEDVTGQRLSDAFERTAPSLLL